MTRLALIALAASALIPATAFAQSNEIAVRFDDLNLSTPAGAATLDKRIDAAARRLCGGEVATGSLTAASRSERKCRAGVRRQVETSMAGKSSTLARK